MEETGAQMKSSFTEKLRDLLIEYKFADSMPVAAILANAMERALEGAIEVMSWSNQWWVKK